MEDIPAEKLDKKDMKILYELDINARQPLSQIAKKVGLSKEVVNYRIKNLMKRNVIEGFYTLIDAAKLGYYTIRVYFNFQNSTEKLEEEVISSIVKHKNVMYASVVAGKWDVVFGICVKSFHEFDEFWVELQRKFGPYLNERYVSVFIDFNHFRRHYLINEKKDAEIVTLKGTPSADTDISKKEMSLLSLIASNARITLAELAKELELTPNAVKYNLKQLEKKNVILGYHTKINLNAIGYHYYKVDLTVEDINSLSQLKSFARMHPNIIYYERTINGSDFEFDLEVKNFEEFLEVMFKIKNEVRVREYTYYRALKVYKTIYLPS